MKNAEGKTLEVGIGTGNNFPYYPENVHLTGIDFSERMIEISKKKIKNNRNIRLQVMDAENMSFAENSFDTVVTSCVFCSVPDPVKGLREIKRVCKDGGNILLLEHVRSNKKVIGKIMDILNPIPLHIYGANINRRTYANLLKAGFDPTNIDIEYLWADIVILFKIKN